METIQAATTVIDDFKTFMKELKPLLLENLKNHSTVNFNTLDELFDYGQTVTRIFQYENLSNGVNRLLDYLTHWNYVLNCYDKPIMHFHKSVIFGKEKLFLGPYEIPQLLNLSNHINFKEFFNITENEQCKIEGLIVHES